MINKDQVQFKRKLSPTGDSLKITIPKELLTFLGAENGTELTLSGYNGKYGKYIAVWVSEEAMSQ